MTCNEERVQVRAHIACAASIFRLIPDTERAVEGLEVDACDLAAYLLEQNDPDWLKPNAIRRWAEVINELGDFPHA